MLDTVTPNQPLGFKPHFVGRYTELGEIDRLWQSNNASLLVVYGRRRVGKTRLFTHWKKHNGHSLYWVAEQVPAFDQLRSFSRALFRFENPDAKVPSGVAYEDWSTAFWHVAQLARKRRIALLIDEVNYLIESDANFIGILQTAWDHDLKDTNILLGLSGSNSSVIEKQIFSYSAPMHGRTSKKLVLKPLPFGTSREFYPNYDRLERIKVYAMFGGVPAYWEKFDDSLAIEENIERNLIGSTYLLDEPTYLLSDHINTPNTYAGIMRAIALGHHTVTEIQRYTQLPKSKVSKYLITLLDTGFVSRTLPVSEDQQSRKSRYVITDHYMRFFYRYLSSNRSIIETDAEVVVDEISETIDQFIEKNIWPELCQEWLIKANKRRALPSRLAIKVGGEWNGRTANVPVVGINTDKQEILIGLNFWTDAPTSQREVHSLVTQAT
ncbi:MAG: ATP-binding protein, partial [Chloroflexota bacterium]